MLSKPFLKIGVIGLGFIGEIYVKLLHENPYVENIFIISSNEKKRNLFKYKYHVDIFDNLEDMIKYGKPHAICICTPNYNHSELAQTILKNNQPIALLLEKPIAINKMQLEALIKTSQSMQERVILVGHSLRFAKPYKIAKQLIESDHIGQVIYIEGRYKWFKNYSDWRSVKNLTGGGFLIQSGIHIIDIFQWFAGEQVVELNGESENLYYPQMEVEDSFFARIKFQNGIFAQMVGSGATKGYIDYGVEVYGTRGAIKISSNAMPGGLEVLNHEISIFNETSNLSQYGSVIIPSYLHSNIWKDQIDHFVDCLLGKEKPLVTLEDAKKTMDICFALYDSAYYKNNKSILL